MWTSCHACSTLVRPFLVQMKNNSRARSRGRRLIKSRALQFADEGLCPAHAFTWTQVIHYRSLFVWLEKKKKKRSEQEDENKAGEGYQNSTMVIPKRTFRLEAEQIPSEASPSKRGVRAQFSPCICGMKR